MKITIDIDCTPAEARSFLGLPDLGPLHDIYVSRMQQMFEKGITPDMAGEIVRSWSTMGDAGIAIARQMFGSIGSAMTGGLGKRDD